ncbi:MAG: acyl-CoA thioesterase [Clostridia bacterium]|nr:acyl-CoA thioesterase [Clostridia bacterium]
MNRPMEIEMPITINGYDVDVMGIVNNIVYIRWFEDLRLQFLAKYYPYDEIVRSGRSPMLMKTEAEYKLPLTIYDKPIGRCWISNMGRLKWEMGYEIVSGENIHCRGKQLGCFYDMNAKKVARLPDKITGPYNEFNEAKDIMI